MKCLKKSKHYQLVCSYLFKTQSLHVFEIYFLLTHHKGYKNFFIYYLIKNTNEKTSVNSFFFKNN